MGEQNIYLINTHIYSPSNKKGIRVNLENLELMEGGKNQSKKFKKLSKRKSRRVISKNKGYFPYWKIERVI